MLKDYETNQDRPSYSKFIVYVAGIYLLCVLVLVATSVYWGNGEYLGGVVTGLSAAVAYWIVYDYRHGTGGGSQ